jgi:Domain of unknown function (DUF4395)
VGIDPRGPRFGALITTVVLAAVLITGSAWLLAAQALVFSVGAVFGLRYAPYSLLYRRLIRPRLGPPGELEPEAPPRFAQAVGLVFALAGVAGYATGLTWLGMAATAAALAAAFLNGVFGFCLGCEMYVLIRRIWPGRRPLVPAGADQEI